MGSSAALMSGPWMIAPSRQPSLPDAVLDNALDAALDACVGAAFVFGDSGAVYRANRTALAVCDADARELLLFATEPGPWPRVVALRGRSATYALRPVALDGAGAFYLAVERLPSQDVEGRITTAAERWRLSRRQSDTLRLLVQGLPNKLIADRLGIALGTVEIHVSKVLRQAGCDSRAALTARFWSEILD
jgi:DNA-binding CsgD family transcriptional regulator